MRIQIVDPAAYTPPYDHALCCALAGLGEDVELVTSRFRHGTAPPPEGYRVREDFYRLPGGLPARIAQHPIDMLRLRRARPDVTHFQWLPIQAVDRFLLPRGPVVLTAHDIVPREPRIGQLRALRALYRRVDAIVVHSEHGRDRLIGELGVDPVRVRVIPHGAFDYLSRLPDPAPLPPELAAVRRPVVLLFGLVRPYKGADVLIDAFTRLSGDAELWIAGMPRMSLDALRAAAAPLGDRVRFVPRFIGDAEIPAFFERADLVVLPYREIDQSGVLYTALAFGRPMILSRAGGFAEFAEQTGAAVLVDPGDPAGLAETIDDLLSRPDSRGRLTAAARAAAAGPYAWDRIARRTLELYRSLV